MNTVFLKLLNMSITASYFALAVIILRLFLKKAPKAITVVMWALVGIRLICPFSFKSILSLIPSTETVPANIIYSDSPAIQSGIPALNSAVNPIITETFSSSAGNSIDTMQFVTFTASLIWIIGIVLMLLYAVMSYLRIYIKIREAAPFKGNIWICDKIATPFILGIFKPRIFLPSDMNEADAEYVIAHETAHLKRCDHFWKPLGFLILTVYWFNPLLWIAYFLLCRDIELACDEKVIREMGNEIKKPYSQALINCSVPRKMVSACPLAFGETDVKGRIKSVLNYKKPAFWVIVVSVVLCTAVALGFATNPITNKNIDDRLAAFIDFATEAHYITERDSDNDNYYCIDWEVLEVKRSSNKTTVYMWVLYMEYSYERGLKIEKSTHIPTVITAGLEDDIYYLYEYLEPTDGPYYEDYIKDKFPWHLRAKALNSERFIDKQKEACEKMAKEHFGLISIIDGYETSVSYAIYKGGASYYTESLNADSMAVSSVQHLPIYKFESENEIKEFKNKFADSFDFSSWYKEIPSFNKAMSKYDSEFFKDNILLTVCVSLGNGLFHYKVNNIDVDGEKLWIHIKKVSDPSRLTLDNDGWFITAEIPRSAIKNITSFDAELMPPIDDEWGLKMNIIFHSDTEFYLSFRHSSELAKITGELSTSSKYEVLAVENGKTVSLEHYIEENYKDSDGALCWDAIKYIIPNDGSWGDSGDLLHTYGKLPSGDYLICKEVNLTTDSGEVYTRVYSASFSVGEFD